MPNPNIGESKQDFINRYMNSPEAKTEGRDKDQLLAVANSKWEEYKKKAVAKSIYKDEIASVMFDAIHGDILKQSGADTALRETTTPGTQAPGMTCAIAKALPEQQLVFGWGNVAKDKDGNYPIDWDGDVTAPEDLEHAAYSHVLKFRATGEQHQGDAVGQLIESVMFTKEKQQAMGIPEGILPEGWWVGYYIPDKEIFAKVKKGEYKMFSVQGDGYRIPTGGVK